MPVGAAPERSFSVRDAFASRDAHRMTSSRHWSAQPVNGFRNHHAFSPFRATQAWLSVSYRATGP
jgi:hypothetical protein